MMRIVGVRTVNLLLNIEVDWHVPLVVRACNALVGMVYYRVGNFNTSLIEIPIDPESGTIYGIDVIAIDCLGNGIDDSGIGCITGLPVVSSASIPASDVRHYDEVYDIAAHLRGECFCVDWSNGREIETRATHDRLTFYLGQGCLLGAAVSDLSFDEQAQLREYLARVAILR